MTQPADNSSDSTAVLPAGATQQLSYSGTTRMPDGYTAPTDYVKDLLNPVKRMEIFEEMGRGDDAVHTAIDARRQEICAANWSLAVEGTESTSTEILEFVEDNIYPILDDLLRWLGGGAMQYGFGCVEPVYQWADAPIVNALSRGKVQRATKSGDRRIYIRKLAHLLPSSIWTFRINDTGDLTSIAQVVFNGTALRRIEVPPEKALLWTYNREGDDYWGVPPTRHCYKAWKFKQQIERLNLLHLDKFAVGTPVAEEGEGWQESDRQRLGKFLEAWRSGSSNYILHPSGGKITIVGDDGKSPVSALEWVRYYNLAIAKTFLTQQTELGSTETGARALGEVFYDQMGGIVQADCEAIATLINNRLIVPLVQYNFGPQASYPTFAPSQRVRAGSGVASVLQQLINAGAIHVRPEDEAYLRDVFELPAVELATLKQEAKDRAALASAASSGGSDPAATKDPNATSTEGDPANPPPNKVRPPAIAASDDAQPTVVLGQLEDGAPAPAVYGQTTYRTPEYSAWEYEIVRPDVLSRDIDLQGSRTTAEVQDVLRAIDAELTRQVEQLANRGAGDLSAGVRDIAVPEKLRKQLRGVVLAAASRARAYGARAVLNEIERQLGPSAIGPQRPSAGVWSAFVRKVRELVGTTEKSPADLHLEAEVDRAVEEEIDRREQSARSSALTALAQAAGAVASVLASVASTAAKSAFLGLSTGRTRDNIEGVINVGFGVGRTETAQAIADPSGAGGGAGGNRSGLRDANGNPVDLVAKVYSAVMDYGTCDECAKWDGAEFPIDYPEDYRGVQAPNPRCAGTIKRCRCIWIYLTSRESVPLVPASKGPQPIPRAA